MSKWSIFIYCCYDDYSKRSNKQLQKQTRCPRVHFYCIAIASANITEYVLVCVLMWLCGSSYKMLTNRNNAICEMWKPQLRTVSINFRQNHILYQWLNQPFDCSSFLSRPLNYEMTMWMSTICQTKLSACDHLLFSAMHSSGKQSYELSGWCGMWLCHEMLLISADFNSGGKQTKNNDRNISISFRNGILF